MAWTSAKSVLLVGIVGVCGGSLSAQEDTRTPVPPASVVQTPPQPMVFPHPDPLPSSADAPVPDLGSLPSVPDYSKPFVRRKLEELAPRCLDGLVHVCWALPAGLPPSPLSEGDREFAKDMEIGAYNFKVRSYRGAEFRFRHALEFKPHNPEATFWLAQSLDKLSRTSEAQVTYRAYLQLQPNGPFAEKSRKALERIEKHPLPSSCRSVF